jgi:hypothetical protein
LYAGFREREREREIGEKRGNIVTELSMEKLFLIKKTSWWSTV